MGLAIIVPGVDWSGYKDTFQVTPINKKKPTAVHIKGPAVLDNNNNQTKFTVGFEPLLTSYRGVTWSIVEGSNYATIDAHGMLNAKYYAADPDNAHDVKIRVTSAFDPSIYEEKVVSVKCNLVIGTVSTNLPAKPQYNKGVSFTLVGYINGEECSLVRFNQPVSKDTFQSVDLSDKLTLVDNLDGTATVTILTDEYLHQVEFTAYNDAYASNTTTVRVNINDKVIINADDSENSAALMAVFYTNSKAADPKVMWQSEAYVVTTI